MEEEVGGVTMARSNYMKRVKRASSPVTPAQSKFATGLARVVKNYINVEGPKRKTPYLRTKRSFER